MTPGIAVIDMTFQHWLIGLHAHTLHTAVSRIALVTGSLLHPSRALHHALDTVSRSSGSVSSAVEITYKIIVGKASQEIL